jgi:hypothetical protein
MKKVELDRIDTYSIKKFLTETGSPIVPLTLVFEALSFSGVTGLDWGILAGAISALAIELGYNIERVGRSIVLVQRKRNLAKEKGGRNPLEIGDQRRNESLELALGGRGLVDAASVVDGGALCVS